MPLGTLNIRRANTNVTLTCDAAAWDSENVFLVSVAGPESSIKAFAACLNLESPTVLSFSDVKEGYSRPPYRGVYKSGYKIRKAKIAPFTWHAVAVADCPGLMPCISEEAVWLALRDPRFTTPVLRPWVAWLMQTIREKRLLRVLRCQNCEVGLLDLDTKALDGLVSRGLRNGDLRIPE